MGAAGAGATPCDRLAEGPLSRGLFLAQLRPAGSERHARRPSLLSQKAKYALRALVELARADGAQLSAGELSLRAGAPRKFLEAILLELSRNQVVMSRRGKFSGYTLARAAA